MDSGIDGQKRVRLERPSATLLKKFWVKNVVSHHLYCFWCFAHVWTIDLGFWNQCNMTSLSTDSWNNWLSAVWDKKFCPWSGCCISLWAYLFTWTSKNFPFHYSATAQLMWCQLLPLYGNSVTKSVFIHVCIEFWNTPPHMFWGCGHTFMQCLD